VTLEAVSVLVSCSILVQHVAVKITKVES